MGLNLNSKICLKYPRIIISVVILSTLLLTGCKVSYSFSGARIAPEITTFSVQYFQNRASLVQVGLSQGLTNALIDKCRGQTSLKYVTGVGDVNFEGEVTDYSTKPYTVAADAQAASNRFTITVRVRFTNSAEPEYSFDQSFSRYQDYNSNLDLSAVEKSLSELIIENLIEDIFNQAFVNW